MSKRRVGMLLGFLAAFVGDWFLAIRGSPRGSAGFLFGVGAFSVAQLLWMSAHVREARPDLRVLTALAVPLGFFSVVRLAPLLDATTATFVCAYSLVSAVSLALALATRRRFYCLGIALLMISDLAIGARWLHVPGSGAVVGPVYILAEVMLLVSFFQRDEKRIDFRRGNPFAIAVWTIFLSLLVFLLAIASFPGGDYNPCMRMLSALGRTEIRLVEYPLCHFLFTLGMLISALGIARISVFLLGTDPISLGTDPIIPLGTDPWRRRLGGIGPSLNVAGLLTIMLIPENISMVAHNAGCWMAALGGGFMLVGWLRGERGQTPGFLWGQTLGILLILSCVMLGLGLILHEMKVVGFAPWVPTAQKCLIVTFMLWFFARTMPFATKQKKMIAGVLFLVICGLGAGVLGIGRDGDDGVCPQGDDGVCPQGDDGVCPLAEDERMALDWLKFVTGPLSPADEKAWWDIGGRQFGVFAKRYHIAFAGYAAAALGLRETGDAAETRERRKRVGRIIGRCIVRYLQPEIWAYSQSKSYWGRKPWAPDPCYRENVMYTGHLLQLLALYERFTGDKRYWKEGFDFVWKDRRVHYDVKKLIDVSVYQMRKGPNGGITCEPGLMFFPCNNHPHIALSIFAALGHGDWSADARRWEKWALGHYRRPLFGGGALNLVYHAWSGILYPRGSTGLDAWSLMWYEPWATDRSAALSLWREAAAKIDWPRMERVEDVKGGADCCDPEPVPPSVAAAFLSAAARACDDAATAERLERALDARHLVRRDGFLYLDLDRAWRIGATAHRIIALAESRGVRFRSFLKRGRPTPRPDF